MDNPNMSQKYTTSEAKKNERAKKKKDVTIDQSLNERREKNFMKISKRNKIHWSHKYTSKRNRDSRNDGTIEEEKKRNQQSKDGFAVPRDFEISWTTIAPRIRAQEQKPTRIVPFPATITAALLIREKWPKQCAPLLSFRSIPCTLR
eukprot:gnl/Spiro4/29525_TR14453_c0_g1_i1.p1 gnl/Spiro4/29525_TR14453_c0_g1~~gnl/Spiro4/29525_TR14453_c0_g1_i1.p1  ORF type:complete len:147 (-),score=3.68 gnl/Spiro4/29525_TR14453_c0_g1_i1:3-443(-)